jgi:hypothetical protein
MGHCEMLLAVAGMSQEEVNSRTRQLAGDWSDLPPVEKAAFTFVRKQAIDPAKITDADITELEQKCGKTKAWQIVWYAASRHYMTKVADAFQLPLERENPFLEMPGAKKVK